MMVSFCMPLHSSWSLLTLASSAFPSTSRFPSLDIHLLASSYHPATSPTYISLHLTVLHRLLHRTHHGRPNHQRRQDSARVADHDPSLRGSFGRPSTFLLHLHRWTCIVEGTKGGQGGERRGGGGPREDGGAGKVMWPSRHRDCSIIRNSYRDSTGSAARPEWARLKKRVRERGSAQV